MHAQRSVMNLQVPTHQATEQPSAVSAQVSGGRVKRKKSSAKEHEAGLPCTDKQKKKRHSRSATAGQEDGSLLNALHDSGELHFHPQKPADCL